MEQEVSFLTYKKGATSYMLRPCKICTNYDFLYHNTKLPGCI